MTNLFEWLGDIIEWFGKFIPRMEIIRSTHKAVKFVRGKNLKSVEPGLCVYWPLVTELDIIPAERQTKNLPPQRLTTKDDIRVVCAAIVVFKVVDQLRAVGKSWDYEDTIRDISMGAIASIIMDTNYDTLRKGNPSEVGEELTKLCRKRLRRFGIGIYSCFITDLCKANVMALSHDNTTIQDV